MKKNNQPSCSHFWNALISPVNRGLIKNKSPKQTRNPNSNSKKERNKQKETTAAEKAGKVSSLNKPAFPSGSLRAIPRLFRKTGKLLPSSRQADHLLQLLKKNPLLQVLRKLTRGVSGSSLPPVFSLRNLPCSLEASPAPPGRCSGPPLLERGLPQV